jgi:hypothetical protein
VICNNVLGYIGVKILYFEKFRVKFKKLLDCRDKKNKFFGSRRINSDTLGSHGTDFFAFRIRKKNKFNALGSHGTDFFAFRIRKKQI